MRRPFIVVGLLALAALAAPPAALYYAAFTPSGLRWCARLIPRHIGHLHLRIEGVSGTAERGMHIDRITIDDRRVHLRIVDVSCRIALSPLHLRTLRVRRLAIRSLGVRVRPRVGYAKRSHWHFLPRGLEIRADRVEVASGTLVVPSGRRFAATHLFAAGLVRRDSARLDQARLVMGRLRVTGHGLLRAGQPFGLNVDTRSEIRVPGQPEWIIAAQGRGSLAELALHVRFIEPLRADFVGRAADLAGHWHWSGRAHVERFEMRPWHGSDKLLGRVTGELLLQGNRGGFTAQGPLEPSGLLSGAFDGMLQGRYADRVITVERLTIRHPVSGAILVGRGSIGIVAHGPLLHLTGTWAHFRWPLAGGPAAVHIPSGRYVLDGLWPYRLQASGRFETAGLEPIDFDLTGRLGKHHLVVSSASLDAFGGTASLSSASAVWSPSPSWSASGTAVGLNPSSLRPDLTGRLSFAFQASGSRFNRRTDFTLGIRRLEGRLRGLAASASGTVSRRGSVWGLEKVHGRLGRTAFTLDGTIDHDLALRFRVAARDLSLVDPRLAGRIAASGTLQGPRHAPSIEAIASGTGIRYRGLSVAGFAARVDFDPRRSGPSSVRFRAHDLAYGRHHLDVAFALSGPAAREQATLSLSGHAYRFESRAVGALAAGVWTGRIEHLEFRGGGERLALEGASALSVSTRAVRLDQLCAVGRSARVCGAGNWAPGAWSASAFANGVPLALLTAGVSKTVHLSGILGAALNVSADSVEPVPGPLSVTLADAQMSRKRLDGRIETTRLGYATLAVSATPQRMDAGLALHAGPVGSIDATLVARRGATPWPSAALSGTLAAQTTLGAWAPLYSGTIDQASGEASARLEVGGTLETPRVTGLIDVLNGALDVYRYNLQASGARIRARLTASGIDFTGETRIGAGSASARGRFDWRGRRMFGKLHLSGTNLRVLDLPQAVVDASPDLDFTIDGRRVTVAGVVHVPRAHIAPANVGNAVRVSPDQIIVGENAPSPAPRLQVASTITIDLGDDVRIATQGLKGRLTGSVRVTTGAGSITRARGQLQIAHGSYSAYGRALKIARGRLIYTASPVDDPGIDIRAERTFQDPDVGAAVAGIDVRGTLRTPRITFFSEPPLPQQEIVSLVFAGGTLLGGPQLGAAAASQNSRSVNAQLIGQGAALLGSQIGLPVAIEPTYDNDTALVLGKYLSPRLYVSYGITLVQSLNIVKLRYTLGDHWALSTEFGQLGGADLVYSFGR